MGVPNTGPVAPARVDPLLGAVLDGKVRLERVLGTGGTGRVYAGTQLSLGRPVAVKVMRSDVAPEQDPHFAERFFREASLAGRLSHPNVVTVHDYGRSEDGACYIVMELLGGRNLKDMMKDGPMPVSRALPMFEQVVAGLRAAHRAGLVHRDMKPGNIQVVEDDGGHEIPKILDFGLVKAEGEVTEITQEGSFLGTPHYAAPEQVKGLDADGRADLYAVGVMLYRALTGRLPFHSANPMAIAIAHTREAYPPMAERAPEVEVPAAVEAVVRRCMEKSPEDRFPDANALYAELVALRRALLPDAPTLEQTPPGPVPPPEPAAALAPSPAAPPHARPRVLAWAGAALVAAGIALGGGAWWAWAPVKASRGPEEALAPAPVAAPPEEPAAAALAAAPEAPPTVQLVLGSAPAGATVEIDGVPVGQTPFSGPVPGSAAAPLTLRVVLDGHHPESLALSVVNGAATAAVVLRPLSAPSPARTVAAPQPSARPVSAPAAPAAAPGGAMVVDDVVFTSAEAEATLAFVNGADRTALLAAGVAPRQADAVLGGQPYPDLPSLGARPQVGTKTIAALRDAAR